MSIFSETKLQLEGVPSVFATAVSNSQEFPMVAVAVPNKVIFFDENGESIDFKVERQFNPSVVVWHPKQPILAIGWMTGAITLVNMKSKRSKEEANYHQTQVLRLIFNNGGDRMLTVDLEGNIALWKDLNCIKVYEKGCEVTSVYSAQMTIQRKNKPPKNLNLFFIGCKDGIVYYVNDHRCEELCQLKKGIVSLMFYPEQKSVVLITEQMDLFQVKISANNQEVPHTRQQLGFQADVSKLKTQWVPPSSFAITCWDGYIRIWNIEGPDNNYTLQFVDPNQENGGFTMISGKVTSSLFNKNTQTLYAGSSEGKLLAFRNLLNGLPPTNSEQWESVGSIDTGNIISNICSGQSGIIAVESQSGVSLVYETKLGGCLNDDIMIYFTTPNKEQRLHLYDARMTIKCFDLRNSKLLVWNGAVCHLCEINPKNEENNYVTQCGQFDCTGVKFLTFHRDGVLCMESYTIKVVNFQGVVKQEINFPKTEGEVIGYDYGKNTLLIHTNSQYLRLVDISRREVKVIGMVKKFEDEINAPGATIKSVRVNSKGNKAIILGQNPGAKCPSIYIWNIDKDSFNCHTFEDGFTPSEAKWELTDSRFFVVYGVFKDENGLTSKGLQSFFVIDNGEVKKHDVFQNQTLDGLFAVKIPNILGIVKDRTTNENINYTLTSIKMKQFSGIDNSDPLSKEAIINFNYYLTEGNMDEAHRSIKSISSTEIWNNMARMSIKSRRLDVAETCIANMRFARGAKALRDLKGKDDLSKLASVAILLNMLEEAKELLREAKRYDLLNDLFQHENNWEAALKVAEENDRINLKLTQYKAAQNYEMHKNFEEAIKYYDLSETGSEEVPRMLLANKKYERLSTYAEASNDNKVYSFQGQVFQQNNRIEDAIKYYQKAEDIGSIVRIQLEKGDIPAAETLCNSSSDPLGCYWLAKHYEEEGDVSKALQFFKKGQHFSHTIRIAKDAGDDNEMYSNALQAPKYVQCRAASYFEKKGFSEKAVVLYMRGNSLKKAMDLAMKNNLSEYIQQISQQLVLNGVQNKPSNMGNLANIFEKQGDNDKAFGMHLAAGKIENALDLLEKENIKLDKNSIKQLIPEEGKNDELRDRSIRIVASRLSEQGKADISAKLYIKIREPILALKSIIKGGDSQKVIKFANQARSSEAYVLAANFLQSADWHQNPQLIKDITNFYKKARRFDSIANFYSSCAMLEIDEYKNYEKALKAVMISKKYAEKGADTKLVGQITEKIEILQKYLSAKEALANDPAEGIKMLKEIVAEPAARDAMRIGDAYALIFDYFAHSGQNDMAWGIIEEMKKKKLSVNRYLDLENVNFY